MLLAEVFGELLAVEFVQVFAGVGELVGARDHQRVVRIVDDAFESRHLHGVDDRGHVVAHEEQAGLGVVDDIMDLLRIELVQDGYGDGAVGERGEEGHGPLAGVAPCEGDLVALHDAAVLEENMEFLNFTCHVVILQRLALIVSQCIAVPVVDDALLDQ